MPAAKNSASQHSRKPSREGCLTLQQQFASPIIRVEVTTGKVLIDAVKDFWDREVVESSTRTAE
ncbi:hypothetical protein [Desulfotomaculum copahuensis]|nr:hypothetical protein [Desulfotomaculum copahuensis]